MNTIDYLLKNSNLPGPRGNLKLLYEFSKNAKDEDIRSCMEFINPGVNNSPEEFAGMCGILSYAVKNKHEVRKVLSFIKDYAGHESCFWFHCDVGFNDFLNEFINKVKKIAFYSYTKA